MEPGTKSWRPMKVARQSAAVGVLALSWLAVGCASDEEGMDSCTLAATIGFDGREYIVVDSLSGLNRREVRIGERLGTGVRTTCPGQAQRPVRVYKLVGVPVSEGVFSKPEFGLMKRWNRDGSIE